MKELSKTFHIFELLWVSESRHTADRKKNHEINFLHVSDIFNHKEQIIFFFINSIPGLLASQAYRLINICNESNYGNTFY